MLPVFVLLVLLAAVVHHLEKVSRMVEWHVNTDFYKFRTSALNLVDGKSPYVTFVEKDHFQRPCETRPHWLAMGGLEKIEDLVKVPLGYERCEHPNLNTPFFVALSTILAPFDFSSGWWAWSLINLVGVLIFALFLAQQINSKNDHPQLYSRWGLIAAGLLCWTPVVVNTELGQVSLLVTLLLILAIRLYNRGAQTYAGIVLGLCVGLKVFVGMFLLTLLFGRYYRVFRGACAGLLISVIIGFWVVGTAGYRDYLYILPLVNWEGMSWNGSWPGMSARFLEDVANRDGVLEFYLGKVFILVGGSLGIHGLWLVNRHLSISDTSDYVFEKLSALTVILALLLSPLGWNYYFVFLALPCILIWHNLNRGQENRLFRMGVVLFLLSTAIPLPLFRLQSGGSSLGELLYASVTFLSLLFLYALFAVHVRREHGLTKNNPKVPSTEISYD